MFCDPVTTCNRKKIRIPSLIVWLIVVILWNSLTLLSETKKPTTRTATGKITAVEQKGKLIIVKWQESTPEGKPTPQEIELQLTPKSQIEIKAPGDTSLLTPGQIVGAVLTESEGGQFHGDQLVVYLGGRQGPSVQPTPDVPHQFNAVGQILAIEGTTLRMSFGEYGTKDVIAPMEPNINVVAGRAEFLKKDLEGSAEFLPSKDPMKPNLLVSLRGNRTTPLDPGELEGTNATKTKTPPAKTSAPRSTTGRKGSKPVLKSGGSTAKDPFGVLDK